MTAAWQGPAAMRIVSLFETNDGLPDLHPAAGKTPTGNRPTAYVCRGPVCSLPITSPEALIAELTS
jgi:uncharacterized protein YyaL (SSP411 family)